MTAKDFARDLPTWFEVEDDDPGQLSLGSREYGDVAEEEPGEKDIAEARRIKAAVLGRFPDATVRIDVIDEWVTVAVS